MNGRNNGFSRVYTQIQHDLYAAAVAKQAETPVCRGGLFNFEDSFRRSILNRYCYSFFISMFISNGLGAELGLLNLTNLAFRLGLLELLLHGGVLARELFHGYVLGFFVGETEIVF